MSFPRAKKRLGQNFLVDGGVAERIVGALGPGADETVVEIGPGRGALTERLAAAPLAAAGPGARADRPGSELPGPGGATHASRRAPMARGPG